ncbi:MAG: hypothetical protein CMD26_03315 [Flavobacteriales bacterium]|nr:hypothetical protein [Flavobacteriales bacterium]
MIQRVQSLYLLIPFLCYLFYWIFGLSWYNQGYDFIKYIPFFLSLPPFFIDFFLSVTSYVPILISVFCFIAIIAFKRRLFQIKISCVSFYLSIFMSIYTLIYFYFSLSYLIDQMPSFFMQVLLFLAMINPFICTFFIFLAIRFIQKDQKLIKSIDRLR